jgi:hypothetical protein
VLEAGPTDETDIRRINLMSYLKKDGNGLPQRWDQNRLELTQ